MTKTNLARTLREPVELVAEHLAPATALPALERVAARYAVAITPDLVELLDTSDPDDPIARQFVPSAAELEMQQGENADPVGDHPHSPVPGIVHRYPDRKQNKQEHDNTDKSRFCFRREMVGPGKE